MKNYRQIDRQMEDCIIQKCKCHKLKKAKDI